MFPFKRKLDKILGKEKKAPVNHKQETTRSHNQVENEKTPNTLKLIGNYKNNTISMETPPKAKGRCELRFWAISQNNTVTIGKNFSCQDLKIIFKGSNNQLIIEDNVSWVGHILIVGENRTVRIGENSTAKGVYILARDADVSIGRNCMLSREIEIRSSDVHKIYDIDTNEHLNPGQHVVIHDNVWVGAKSLLSKGTIIPTGSIIGAASFVNKKFTKQNTIIARTPAKIVKENIRWER